MAVDIDNLTVGEAKKLAAMFGPPTNNRDDGHWVVGEAYFIRTVTHHLLGKLVKVTPQELVIVDAAWIADDGRFNEFLATGNANEVEPYPDGMEVIVGRGSLIDAVKWGKPLLRVVR